MWIKVDKTILAIEEFLSYKVRPIADIVAEWLLVGLFVVAVSSIAPLIITFTHYAIITDHAPEKETWANMFWLKGIFSGLVLDVIAFVLIFYDDLRKSVKYKANEEKKAIRLREAAKKAKLASEGALSEPLSITGTVSISNQESIQC